MLNKYSLTMLQDTKQQQRNLNSIPNVEFQIQAVEHARVVDIPDFHGVVFFVQGAIECETISIDMGIDPSKVGRVAFFVDERTADQHVFQIEPIASTNGHILARQ